MFRGGHRVAAPPEPAPTDMAALERRISKLEQEIAKIRHLKQIPAPEAVSDNSIAIPFYANAVSAGKPDMPPNDDAQTLIIDPA